MNRILKPFSKDLQKNKKSDTIRVLERRRGVVIVSRKERVSGRWELTRK